MTGVVGSIRTPSHGGRGVTNRLVSSRSLESAAKEGNSPVSENGVGSLGSRPKYHGTRGTPWESARTISQG